MEQETMERRARQAKERWGQTEAYRQYAEKSRDRSAEEEQKIGAGLMSIFGDFDKHRDGDPKCDETRGLVMRLQAYISEHYYRCTPEILRSLGQMYAAGGEFTENIDKAGGAGTAQFVKQAIDACFG